MTDAFPRQLGLCPDHGQEFYYPLRDDESPTCPVCGEELVVYEHRPESESDGAIIERMARAMQRVGRPHIQTWDDDTLARDLETWTSLARAAYAVIQPEEKA